ncbi:hypothetical protein [Helicobacter sp.]|uniref:hypothetical protein n=1 Tax=Helicobacter sp. TaxID=218 RepID=UPI0019ACB9B3|nr:hypothetical protein [Helicobacter sp.]MBD5164554.1 hypothetical protein [Helicobacter sp.]
MKKSKARFCIIDCFVVSLLAMTRRKMITYRHYTPCNDKTASYDAHCASNSTHTHNDNQKKTRFHSSVTI